MSVQAILSPAYNLYDQEHDFQSNLATIRTSRPGAALYGLGIECPDFLTTNPTLDAGTRNNLYTPGFFQSNPTKRDYQSTTSEQDSKPNPVLGWCPPAWSPFGDSPALPPGLPVPAATNTEQKDSIKSESPGYGAILSFFALSAASGLSPNVLATHISASAEITLQLMSNDQPDIPYIGITNDNQCQQPSAYPWPLPCLPTPEMVPPIADINMRELTLANQEADVGVDPTDTFLVYPLSPVLPLPDSCRSPDSSFADAEDNDCDEDLLELGPGGEDATENKATDSAQSQTTPRVTADDVKHPSSSGNDNEESSPPIEPLGEAEKEQDTCEDYDPSEYEPSVLESPSDQEYSPSTPNLIRRRTVKRKEATDTEMLSARVIHSAKQTVLDPYHSSIQLEKEDVNSKIDLGTPVINAHFGVTLSELQEKAERYRIRNNIPLTGDIELEYDKRWLLAFVGKLSQQGELVHEFRCYVIGCAQTNKRRDHILIHLGGHLGHRPFKCSVWYVLVRLYLLTSCVGVLMCRASSPSRFLRKNECKRHELSHSGARPFICDLCLVSFVRQDLLKRHTNRTHGGARSSKRKQNGVDSKRPTKKSKAR